MDMELAQVQVSLIRANYRDNLRTNLGDLTELADSIREQGILVPLILRPASVIEYRVLDGYRRLAAARMVGLDTVPALTSVADPTVVALITGGQGRPLRPLEMAHGFGKLQAGGCTQAQISRLTGFSQSTVSARLALLALDQATMHRVERGLVGADDALAAVRSIRATTPPAAGGRRQPRAARSVSSRRPTVAPYFGPGHALAELAASRCKHRSSLRRDSSTVACGACWEATIRDDERRRQPVLGASA